LEKPDRNHLEHLTGYENQLREEEYEAPSKPIVTTEKVIENVSLEKLDDEVDAECITSKPDQETAHTTEHNIENYDKCQQNFNQGNKSNPSVVTSNENSRKENKNTSLIQYILNILYIFVLVGIFILSVLFGKEKGNKNHNS